jgi:hypothetical protein
MQPPFGGALAASLEGFPAGFRFGIKTAFKRPCFTEVEVDG